MSLTLRHIFQPAPFDLTYSKMKRIKRRITACILMVYISKRNKHLHVWWLGENPANLGLRRADKHKSLDYIVHGGYLDFLTIVKKKNQEWKCATGSIWLGQKRWRDDYGIKRLLVQERKHFELSISFVCIPNISQETVQFYKTSEKNATVSRYSISKAYYKQHCASTFQQNPDSWHSQSHAITLESFRINKSLITKTLKHYVFQNFIIVYSTVL